MSSKSIMVVDDDDDVRRMLCVILEGEGYNTVAAADGVEALERMRVDPPSLVFVDLMMPRMDGAHLIRSMNGDAGLSHIPIAIMSGQTTAPADAVALAKARLMKPVELEDVLSLASRYMHTA